MAGEMYDTDFKQDLEKAVMYVSEISDKDQKRMALKWINKIISLQSDDPQVKKNRNCFLKYFLTVLKNSEVVSAEQNSGDVLVQWSPDHRIYVAIKPLPNEGVLVYMAVVDDVTQGWDFPKPDAKQI